MELTAAAGFLEPGTRIQSITGGSITLSSAPMTGGTNVELRAARVATSSPILVNLAELRLPEFSRSITDIGSGAEYNFIKTSDGQFWAWGSGSDGQLGNGTFVNKAAPSAFPIPAGESFSWIAVGANYALATTNNGALYSWGGNQFGQRGDGTTNTVPEPQRHKGITDYFLQVSNVPDSEGQQQVRARVQWNESKLVEVLVVVGPSTAGYVTPGAPVITQQPESLMMAAGASASLGVVATSDLPLSYQWMLNGNNISVGGISANYNLNDSANTPAAGLYSVKVSDARGSVFSDTVQVAVVRTPQMISDPQAKILVPKTTSSIEVLMQSQFKTLFNSPRGLAIRGTGELLVADRDNSVVRVMNDGGFVGTLVGMPKKGGWVDSVGSLSRLVRPEGISVINVGEFELIFISDPGSQTVRCLTREFDATEGKFLDRLRTVAGLPMQAGFFDGDVKEAKFNSPAGLSGFVYQRKDSVTRAPLADKYEVHLYVADVNNHAIRLVMLPVSITEDNLASDPRGRRVLQMMPGVVMSVAGATPLRPGDGSNDSAGKGEPAGFLLPTDVAAKMQSELGYVIYVADSGNHSIRIVEASAPEPTRVLQSVNIGKYKGTSSTYITWSSPSGPVPRPAWVQPGMKISKAEFIADDTYVSRVDDGGAFISRSALKDGTAPDVEFTNTLGNSVFTTYTFAGTPGISGANDGLGLDARFLYPQKVVLAEDGALFVTDTNNFLIRKITPSLDPRIGIVRVFAGVSGKSGSIDGPAALAQFTAPKGIAVSPNGAVYVSDDGAHLIRKIYDLNGLRMVATLGGVARIPGHMDSDAVSEYTYQWKKNGASFGAAVQGEAGRRLTFNGEPLDSAVYSVEVTSPSLPNFKVSSQPAQVTVPSSTVPVAFTESVTLSAGGTYSLDFNKLITKYFPGMSVRQFIFDTVDSRGRSLPGWMQVPAPSDPAVLRLSPDSETSAQSVVTRVSAVFEDGSTKLGYLQVTIKGARVEQDYTPIILRQPVSWISTDSTPSTERLSVSIMVGEDFTTSYQWYQKQKPTSPYFSILNPSVVSANFLFRSRQLAAQGDIAYAKPIEGGSASFLPAALSPPGIYALKVTNTPVPAAGQAPSSSGFSRETDTVQVVEAGTLRIIQQPFSYLESMGKPVNLRVYPKTSAKSLLNEPRGIAYNPNDQSLLLVELGNYAVRSVSLGGEVADFAGSRSEWGEADSTSTGAARFGRPDHGPVGLAVDSSGTAYVADTMNHAVRMIHGGTVSTIAGFSGVPGSANGSSQTARFNLPSGLAVRNDLIASGTVVLYVADTGNHLIRKITLKNKGKDNQSVAVQTLAGGTSSLGEGIPGYKNGPGADAKFSEPIDVAYFADKVFVADFKNHAVRYITDDNSGIAQNIRVYTLAGGASFKEELSGLLSEAFGGTVPQNYELEPLRGFTLGKSAKLTHPTGVAADGVSVYVVDWGNHALKKMAFPSGDPTQYVDVELLAGENGAAGESGEREIGVKDVRFKEPTKITVDPLGNLYVADSLNHVIRRIGTDQRVTTVAGVEGLPGDLNSNVPVEFYYQWCKDGRPITDGRGNASSYQIESLSAASEGLYSVLISTNAKMTSAVMSASASVKMWRSEMDFLPVVAGQTGVIGRSLFDLSSGALVDSAALAQLPNWARVDGSGNLVLSPGATVADGRVRLSYGGNFVVDLVSKTQDSLRARILLEPGDDYPSLNGPLRFEALVQLPGSSGIPLATILRDNVRWLKMSNAGQALQVGTLGDAMGLRATLEPDQVNPDILKVTLDTPRASAAGAGFYRLELVPLDGGAVISSRWSQAIFKTSPVFVKQLEPDTFFNIGGSLSLIAEARTPAKALFQRPVGLAVLPNSSGLLIADEGDRTIRVASPGGRVSNFVGASGLSAFVEGSGKDARLGSVEAIAHDPGVSVKLKNARTVKDSAWIKVDGSDAIHLGMTVSDDGAVGAVIPNGSRIEEIGQVDGFTWNIRLSLAAKRTADGLVLLASREQVTYLADSLNHVICKVSPNGEMRIFCGSLGIAGDAELSCSLQDAKFNAPQGVTVDPWDGTVYVSDTGNHAIRMIQPSSFGNAGSTERRVYLIAGGTLGDLLQLSSYSPQSSVQIRQTPDGISLQTPTPLGVKLSQPLGIAARTRFLKSLEFKSGRYVTEVFVADRSDHVIRVIRLNARNSDKTPALLGWVGAQRDYNGYLRDGLGTRVLDVRTWAGQIGFSGDKNGPGDLARFYLPYGLAIDFGNEVDGSLYVADQGNHLVRRIQSEFDARELVFKDQGTVETVAGVSGIPGATDGLAIVDQFLASQGVQAASLSSPTGVAVDSKTGDVFVADTGNYSIRVLKDGDLQTRLGVLGAKGSYNYPERGDGLSYQWYKDGSPLSGGTASTLSFKNVSVNDLGAYQLEVRSETTVRSNTTLVRAQTAIRFLESPLSQILYPPQSGSLSSGGVWKENRGLEVDPDTSLKLTGKALGAGSLNYQWRKNGVPLSDGVALSGAAITGASSPTIAIGQGGWKRLQVAVAGPTHSAAISDGTLYMWGGNREGQLGFGDRVSRSRPQALPAGAFNDSQVKEVALGRGFTLARTADGSIFGWGINADGQLGAPSSENVLSPRKVDLGSRKIRAISAGSNHCLAVVDDGAFAANVLSWGGGSVPSAQLGRKIDVKCSFTSGSYSAQLISEPWADSDLILSSVGMLLSGDTGYFLAPPRIVSVTSLGGETIINLDQKAMKSGESEVSFSHPSWRPSPVLVRTNDDRIRLLKAFDFSKDSPERQKLISNGKNLDFEGASCVATGSAHSLVLGDDLKVYGFGSNASGQVGQSDTFQFREVNLAMAIETTSIPGETFRSVAAGDLHSLALTSEGVLVSWGDNGFKQLGRAVIKSSAWTPKELLQRLGLTTFTLSSSTLTLSDVNFLRVDEMTAHFEQHVGGGSWSAYSGWSGQNKKWTTVFSDSVTNRTVDQVNYNSGVVTLGGMFSLELDRNQDEAYQFVFADKTAFSGTPRKAFYVDSDTQRLRSIAAGGCSNIAIGVDNRVYVWGRNNSGQLGIEWTDIAALAAPQPLEFFSSVLSQRARITRASVGGQGTGTGHSFALDSQGMLFVWGENGDGQLGDGSLLERRTPSYNAFSDYGSYTLTVDSSSAAEVAESAPVVLVQPEVEAPGFGEWPRALLNPERRVSYRGSTLISIPEPLGYPKPEVLWSDGDNQSFGTSYVVSNVENKRPVSVTLGRRDANGNFIPLPDRDLLNRWSFNPSSEPARLRGRYDFSVNYRVDGRSEIFAGTVSAQTYSEATNLVKGAIPVGATFEHLSLIPSANPNYDVLEGFRDGMLKQRDFRNQDANNFSVWGVSSGDGLSQIRALLSDPSDFDYSNPGGVLLSGGTVNFKSGVLNAGVMKAGTLMTLPNRLNQAATYVSLPVNLTSDGIIKNGLTIEVWAALNDDKILSPTIFSLGDFEAQSNVSTNVLWAGYSAQNDTNRPALSSLLSDSVLVKAESPMFLVPRKIYHWALVINPLNSKATLYRDGVEACSMPVKLDRLKGLKLTEVRLGKSLTYLDPHTSATYSEARVWSRCLTSAEIGESKLEGPDAELLIRRKFTFEPSGFTPLTPDWQLAGGNLRRDPVVTVSQGDRLTLSAAFDGEPWEGLTYRWKKDGIFLNGENQSTLDFSNKFSELDIDRGIALRQAGSYQVVVSDGFVVKESPAVSVVVNNKPSITVSGDLNQDRDIVKVSSVSNLRTGMAVTAVGIPKGAIISDIDPTKSEIKLSALASASAKVTMVASLDSVYRLVVDTNTIGGQPGVADVQIFPQLDPSNPYFPAGTLVRILGVQSSGILRGWSITDPKNSDIEYGQIQANGSWVYFVMPARDIKITPIVGPALQGLYTGFVTSTSGEQMTAQTLGKVRGYFAAAVMPQGSSSCILRVDGKRYQMRPNFDWIQAAKTDVSVVDEPAGVTVVDLLEDGIADVAGLIPGDVIQSVLIRDQAGGDSTPIELYDVRDFDAYLTNAKVIGKTIELSVLRSGVKLAQPIVLVPGSEWYMRAMVQVDASGLGNWVGQITIKSDEKRGTRAHLNLRNVSLKNPAFNSTEVSTGNEIFCNAYTSVGAGKTEYAVHSAALYKGRGNVQNLGEGGVFLIQTDAPVGTAMMYGRFGNGRSFSVAGVVGRLFPPSRAKPFDSEFLSDSSEYQSLLSSEIPDDSPESAMLEAVRRKSNRAVMPIYSTGDVRTDFNFIAGALVFDSENVYGSVGMINRPLNSNGFETEYTPNRLVGHWVKPTSFVPSLSTPMRPSEVVNFYSGLTYPKPVGFGSYYARYFGMEGLLLQKLNPEVRVPNVESFTIGRAVSALFRGSFKATDARSREIAQLIRTPDGLLNTIYGVAIGGQINAGVGFINRGRVLPNYTQLIGNKQTILETADNELPSVESLRFDAP
jgi:alpha-tubulin suppressor-like RCC1 family protein